MPSSHPSPISQISEQYMSLRDVSPLDLGSTKDLLLQLTPTNDISGSDFASSEESEGVARNDQSETASQWNFSEGSEAARSDEQTPLSNTTDASKALCLLTESTTALHQHDLTDPSSESFQRLTAEIQRLTRMAVATAEYITALDTKAKADRKADLEFITFHYHSLQEEMNIKKKADDEQARIDRAAARKAEEEQAKIVRAAERKAEEEQAKIVRAAERKAEEEQAKIERKAEEEQAKIDRAAERKTERQADQEDFNRQFTQLLEKVKSERITDQKNYNRRLNIQDGKMKTEQKIKEAKVEAEFHHMQADMERQLQKQQATHLAAIAQIDLKLATVTTELTIKLTTTEGRLTTMTEEFQRVNDRVILLEGWTVSSDSAYLNKIRFRVVIDEFQRRMAIVIHRLHPGKLGKFTTGFSNGSLLFRELLAPRIAFKVGHDNEQSEDLRRLQKATQLIPLNSIDNSTSLWTIRNSPIAMRLLTERVSSIREAGNLVAHTLVDSAYLQAILTESQPPPFDAVLMAGMKDIIEYIAATPDLAAIHKVDLETQA